MGYKIKLDVFEGPLDLLLHLIKDNEVDIYEIPIALITKQYLEYIEVMNSLNLEIAGDYLLMASQLTYIKSKLLLPNHEQELEEMDNVDPREELVAKLIEYKKFKEASQELKTRELNQSMVFTRTHGSHEIPKDADLLIEVNVFELLKSFKKILDDYKGDRELSVSLDEISVTEKINQVMTLLEKAEYATFGDLFLDGRSKAEIVATFLALLELMKLRLLRVVQVHASGEMMIYIYTDGDSRTIDDQREKEWPKKNKGSSKNSDNGTKKSAIENNNNDPLNDK